MNVKKGDKVIVLKGKDRGKTAKVVKAFPKENKVVLEGLNLKKMHERSRKQGKKGQIVEKPAPMDASNVKVIEAKV